MTVATTDRDQTLPWQREDASVDIVDSRQEYVCAILDFEGNIKDDHRLWRTNIGGVSFHRQQLKKFPKSANRRPFAVVPVQRLTEQQVQDVKKAMKGMAYRPRFGCVKYRSAEKDGPGYTIDPIPVDIPLAESGVIIFEPSTQMAEDTVRQLRAHIAKLESELSETENAELAERIQELEETKSEAEETLAERDAEIVKLQQDLQSAQDSRSEEASAAQEADDVQDDKDAAKAEAESKPGRTTGPRRKK